MKKKIDFEKIPDREKAERLEAEYLRREHIHKVEQELQERLALNYRYYRFYKKGKEVSVSVGYKISGDILSYTVALQSKNDKFSRKEARRVINDRWDRVFYTCIDVPFPTREIDVLIALSYNGMIRSPGAWGISKIPDYLKKIPIYLE